MKDPPLALHQGLLNCEGLSEVALEPRNQIFTAAESQAAVDWGQVC